MIDYYLQAKKILQLIGGKENILSLTHCFTRLRFVLKDFEAAKTEEIRGLEGVKGIWKRSGSYQIVIGTAVTGFYRELEKLLAE
ncbi:MAG: PTS glucose/sucrose transporter subunit IIB [Lachnospiraceae bacterium]|nr:PTS glucose/sucrose transporter subunit IIB [Lachnospiraceae bacterium]